ncbi:winged helix-turn-helix transcriptional regulator [Klenkia brasiliensis]|uniref:Transcriptional regulator, HxlR family n=1 Tax=Klenkia brasiliensis TaxID=333142 RepID=A0A1G8A4Y9_9ACTN|nr:helix-turn-helix domain-containing protein [Klenkia brasiliensis]SDH15907.1 transcriptional regulator, HxlR family [Klenkia brasiliensis]
MSLPLGAADADPGESPTPLPAGGVNQIGATLPLIGDEWNLLLVQQSLLGARRFGEWKARLPISNSVLTNRLTRLTEVGVHRRQQYSERPERHEYLLTARGRALWPVMLSIWEWERRWVPEHAAALPHKVHRSCGSAFRALLTCEACGGVVHPRDVAGSWGPSGSWERSVPAATTRRRAAPAAPVVGVTDGPGMFPETMALIGNRWSSALLGAAFRGATRFGEFQTFLGAPPTVVSDRLRTFTDLGVLAPRPDPERADWAQYHLTDKGRAFFPVVETTLRWGQDWFRAPEGPAVVQVHRGCGQTFEPCLACDVCRSRLRGADIEIVGAAAPSLDEETP